MPLDDWDKQRFGEALELLHAWKNWLSEDGSGDFPTYKLLRDILEKLEAIKA